MASESVPCFKSNEDAANFIKDEYAKLLEVMKKVFESLDADKSGYIDLKELKEMSKELGKEMDNAELEECIKDLDENKDGKISFEEF